MTAEGTGGTREELLGKAAADPAFAETLNSQPTVEVLRNMEPDPFRSDTWVRRVTVLSLAFVALLVIGGSFALVYMGRTAPEGPMTLAGVALTALAQMVNNNRSAH